MVGAVFAGGAVEAQGRALAAVGSTKWVMLDASDGAVCVPAENLIAAGRAAGTRVAVVARNAQQVAGLAKALQLGVDALVLPAQLGDGRCREDTAWTAAVEAKEARKNVEVPESGDGIVDTRALKAAKVTSVEAVGGLADRVCLDLIQMMREGEGALVGSTAKALCVVQAETAQTGLVPPRPFRINAGPVHAYVALKGGRTKYLSEVEAGDEVVVVDASAGVSLDPPPSRCIAIGRCKTEPRPVICVRFCDDDGRRSGQLLLQQAETVRLPVRTSSTTGWCPQAVTDLVVGSEIMVRWASLGTHCGTRIAASVSER